jgi:hypothetical protein
MNYRETKGYHVSFTFPAALDDLRWALHVTTANGEPQLLDGTLYRRLEEAQAQALRFGYLRELRPARISHSGRLLPV